MNATRRARELTVQEIGELLRRNEAGREPPIVRHELDGPGLPGGSADEGIHDVAGRPMAHAGNGRTLALRPTQWWENIVTTCSNTMVFFASTEHRDASDLCAPPEQAATLTPDEVHALSEPTYRTKLALDYARPTREELLEHFATPGLTGEYWRIRRAASSTWSTSWPRGSVRRGTGGSAPRWVAGCPVCGGTRA